MIYRFNQNLFLLLRFGHLLLLQILFLPFLFLHAFLYLLSLHEGPDEFFVKNGRLFSIDAWLLTLHF